VRLTLVAGVLGKLLQVFALAFLAPLGMGAWDAGARGGSWNALLPYAVGGLLTFGVGRFASRWFQKAPNLLRAEALAIVAGSWIVAGQFAAIPFWWGGLDYFDGLFEAVSGLTTTGASVLTDFSVWDRSVFLWRAVLHWIGGFGVVAMFVVILPQLGVAGRQIFFAESSTATADVISPRLRSTAWRILWLYLTLTLAEILALIAFTNMPVFDVVCNSLATISTGGFSPHPLSIAGYQSPAAEWIITFFMLISGISFPLLWIGFFRRPGDFLRDTELRLYLAGFAVCTLGAAAVLAHGLPGLDTIRNTAFNVATVISACGFASSDWAVAPWTDGARIFLLIALLLCSCAGSTGGGPKVIRWLLTFKFMHRELVRVLHPRGVLPIRHKGHPVPEEALRAIVAVVAVYCFAYMMLGSFLTVFGGGDMISSFSGAVACINNAGPGFGAAGPMYNYSFLNEAGTLACTIGMWLGRLEFVTVLVLLHPDVLRKLHWRSEDAAVREA
jgi:trk system potassium uptake protein TrkH